MNELSLQGQFATALDFVGVLGKLYTARVTAAALTEKLYFSRLFGEYPVTVDKTCREAVMIDAPRDIKGAILGWITKYGPFLDDDRQAEEEDYFEFEGTDVTEQGLGESARRLHAGERADVFSFLGGAIDFERSPLVVDHGLHENRLGSFQVRNHWKIDELTAVVTAGQPANWDELIKTCGSRFDRLAISQDVLPRLNRETFYPVVADRTLELLRILQEVMEGRTSDGSLNPEALSLWQTMTRGSRARFSDESDGNKDRFRNEMTFVDQTTDEAIFCPWHGKIQTPAFRIHFEWPVPVTRRQLQIFYIGPKITKG